MRSKLTKKDEYIFGFHAIRQFFKNDISRVLELWVQQKRNDAKMQTLLQQAKQQAISIQSVQKKTLDKLTENGHHQGIVIRCKANLIKTKTTLEDLIASLKTPPFLLILDEVQDPQNLGSCLRTADAAGIDAVIVPKNQACKLSAIVHVVACGAADTVPLVQVTNLASALRWLKEQGIWLIGLDEKAETSLFDAHLTGPIALILGGEGKGLRRLSRENCDLLVRIPMLGEVESLNVSVAAGVCLYDAVRQRAYKSGNALKLISNRKLISSRI